jgi:NAD(P)H-dependent FMN reductase
MIILGISGSIRKDSSNLALLRAMRTVAPPGVELRIFDGIDRLPFFNPDLDADPTSPPESVRAFRKEIASAVALVISTPEYAHGIPGVLKNALDWLVSDVDFAGKRVGLVYGSATDGSHARASLLEVLKTMSAKLDDAAIASIPGVRTKVGPNGEVRDPATVQELLRVLNSLTTD